MAIKIHPHAKERMEERGASESEVIETVKYGEEFPAKFDRVGYRSNFNFNGVWRGKKYKTKQIEAYTFKEGNDIIMFW